MSEFVKTTSGFVQSAKAVSASVEILKAAVAGGDAGDIDFASEAVASAADLYAGKTQQYGQYGFDQLTSVQPVGGPADATKPNRERISSDLLASALLDLQVADTLITAGRAAGEMKQSASLDELDAAANRLNDLANAVALPIGKSTDTSLGAARFGFDAVPAPVAPSSSPSLTAAREAFERRVTDVCKDFVAQTKKVLQEAYKGLKSLDAAQLLEAVNSLGDTAVAIPDVGKLISKGLKMAVSALEKLSQALKSATLQNLREQAGKLIEKLTGGGDLVDNFLRYTYNFSDAQQRLKELAATAADKDKIDKGSTKLAELQSRFDEQMTLLSKIVTVLGGGKAVLGFVLPQVISTVIFGASYLLVMNYAVLTGMDYADAAGPLHFVDGLVKISVSTLA